MEIKKIYGSVLALTLVGATAWIVARTSLMQTVRSAHSSPGAALAEVQVPAKLSTKAAAGKTFYDADCASCYGANAAGQDAIAPPLVHKIYEPSHHGDAAFLVAVRNGTRQHHWSFGSMLPVDQKLTDGEIAAITLYVRELQRENGII